MGKPRDILKNKNKKHYLFTPSSHFSIRRVRAQARTTTAIFLFLYFWVMNQNNQAERDKKNRERGCMQTKNETKKTSEKKVLVPKAGVSELQVLLLWSHSSHRALLLAAASTTFGGAPAIGAPPSPFSNASAKVSRSVADAALRSAAACRRACAAETSPVVWILRLTTASEGCGME